MAAPKSNELPGGVELRTIKNATYLDSITDPDFMERYGFGHGWLSALGSQHCDVWVDLSITGDGDVPVGISTEDMIIYRFESLTALINKMVQMLVDGIWVDTTDLDPDHPWGLAQGVDLDEYEWAYD